MTIITGTGDFQALFQGLLSEIVIVDGQPFGVPIIKLTSDSSVSSTSSGGTTNVTISGIIGEDEGAVIGTGSVLNFVGDNISLSISGTTFRIEHTNPYDNIGFMAYDDGSPIGTGTAVNFGSNLSVVRSGTVLFVDASATGGGGGSLGIMGQDEAVDLGTGTVLNVVGENISLSISGTVLTLEHTNPTFPDNIGVMIYDGNTAKGTGTAISFGDNLTAVVSGTVAFVDSSGLANPVQYIQFDTTVTGTPVAAGIISWNDTDKTLDLQQPNSTQQIGQEVYIRAVNKTLSLIPNGSLVYINGSQGNRPTIALAMGDAEATSHCIGMTTENIANNDEGFVTTFGYVRDIDTTGGAEAWAEGDELWVSKTVAGSATNVEPQKPHHSIKIGVVTNAHLNQGSVLIQLGQHSALEDLSDVSIASVTNGDFIQYNSASGTWLNTQLSTATLIHSHSGTSSGGTILQVDKDIYRFGFIASYDGAQETTLAFDGTGTVSITPTATLWSYYRNGLKHTITGSKSVALAADPIPVGSYYIYIDSTDGTLISSTGGWTLEDTKVPVAFVAWNSSLTPKYWIADERHTVAIDRRYHFEHHFTDGTEMATFPTLSAYTVTPTVPTNAHNTFSVSQAVAVDEDLKHVIPNLVTTTGTTAIYTVLYRNTGTWNWESSVMPYRYTAAGYIQYDNSGVMTQGTFSKLYNTYLLVTNMNGALGFTTLHGKGEYSTLADAQAEKFSDLTKTGIPLSEYVACYQITWATSNSYTNNGKCRIAATPVQISVSASGFGGIQTADHETLSNLLGGTSGEHYHVTQSQHTQLVSGTITQLHSHYAPPSGTTGQVWTYNTGSYNNAYWANQLYNIEFFLGNGFGVVPTGAIVGGYHFVEVPYASQIDSWSLLSDATGSITINVLASTGAGFPPTSPLAGLGQIILTSQRKNSGTPTGTTTLAAQDVLLIEVASASTVKIADLSLRARKL